MSRNEHHSHNKFDQSHAEGGIPADQMDVVTADGGPKTVVQGRGLNTPIIHVDEAGVFPDGLNPNHDLSMLRDIDGTTEERLVTDFDALALQNDDVKQDYPKPEYNNELVDAVMEQAAKEGWDVDKDDIPTIDELGQRALEIAINDIFPSVRGPVSSDVPEGEAMEDLPGALTLAELEASLTEEDNAKIAHAMAGAGPGALNDIQRAVMMGRMFPDTGFVRDTNGKVQSSSPQLNSMMRDLARQQKEYPMLFGRHVHVKKRKSKSRKKH